MNRQRSFIRAVDGVDIQIRRGEIFGLVGESGCGKTTLGRLLALLETPTAGIVRFDGADVSGLRGSRLRGFRRRVQMIFQDPYASLNPRFTIHSAVMDPLLNQGVVKSQRMAVVLEALERAELSPPERYLHLFPHELSGGQRQRVAIARALVLQPEFIVADEPVSMLDVSIRAGILNLMLKLKTELGVSYLFITHDLAVARHMSDRIGIMYLGNMIEVGPTERVIQNAGHPYTMALLSAVPVPDPESGRERMRIRGEATSVVDPPSGCKFRPRCPFSIDRCKDRQPDLTEFECDHFVACDRIRSLSHSYC